MAEEFQGGICSANWWNSARNIPTPCSTTLIDVGSLGWSNDQMEMKARTCSDSVSVSCNSMVFQDIQSLQESDSIGGGDSVLTDSTLQMMGYSLSSQTTEWNQTLSRSTGRSSELKVSSMLQEDYLSSKSIFQQQFGLDPSHGHNEWSPKNHSDDSEDSSRNPFKQINQVFSLQQHDLDPTKNSDDSTVTSQGFPCMNYPTITASTLLPGLYELDPQSQQRPYSVMNYASPVNSPTFSNQFIKTSPPKRQSDTNQLHFSNNTPFLNASSNAMNDARSSLSVSTQPQPQTSPFNEKGSNCSNNFPGKFNSTEVQDSCSLVKKTCEPTFKRPRIETPSPLPTFKVRKEKLGDRITALQQLVSPFGKTDTASVLFEAIEYIKFLHEKVGVLSTPYMKNGVPTNPTQYQQNSDTSNDSEGLKENLKSRGLCLVPISSTFPVINETTADFWTSTFGGSYM